MMSNNKYIITYECHDNAPRMWKVVQLIREIFWLLPLSIRKTADLPLQLWVDTFPRFVTKTQSWLSDFIFYLKPLYKSLHQSLGHRRSLHEIIPSPLFFFTFCLHIYFQENFFISLLFHLFFLILTCSCPYSYNFMLTFR
jgi:hypothetical protein